MDAVSDLLAIQKRVVHEHDIVEEKQKIPHAFVIQLLRVFLAVDGLGISTFSCSPLPLGDPVGASPLTPYLYTKGYPLLLPLLGMWKIRLFLPFEC